MAKKRRGCHYCGVKLRDGIYSRDHIVPKSLGGSNARWNLVGSCRDCNQRKAASTSYRDHCLLCLAAWEIHEGLIDVPGLDLSEFRRVA